MKPNNMKNLPIQVNQRYKSSTRIDTKLADFKSFINDFVLHGTAVSVLGTLSSDVSGSEQRAYTLTGPYGSGKSTFALFLSSLLSSNKKERNYAAKKLEKADGLLSNFSSNFNVKKGWQVVKHVCGLEAPANSILISLYEEFGVNFESNDVEQLNDRSDVRAGVKHVDHNWIGGGGVIDGRRHFFHHSIECLIFD